MMGINTTTWSTAGTYNERLGEKTPQTAATILRDKIWELPKSEQKVIFNKLRTPPYQIPRKMHGPICQMFNYNSLNRLKDRVEEALFDNVCYCIVCELLDKEGL